RDHRDGAEGDESADAPAQTAVVERGEDEQDWERRQQQAVGGAVDDPAPEERAGELDAAGVRRAALGTGCDDCAEAGKDNAEADGEPPVAGEQLAQRLARVARPGEE